MNRTHFVIDEAASVLCGQFTALEDALDKYRAFGVCLQLYFQSMGQLKKCFPDGGDQTLLSNSVQIHFATNDYATAEAMSARLGASTIVVGSGGTSSGYSRQRTHSSPMQSSHSESFNRNDNWQQQARKLLLPEEILTLPPRTAITFVPGMPPICTTLMRYYEEPVYPRFRRIKRWGRAGMTLIASGLLAIVLIGTAAALTTILVKQIEASRIEQPTVGH